MPRDGSGIYTYPPGTPGIPDTTIESAKYNGYIADIQQDLNLPRPIVAGGTGANSALQARDNLDAEVASAQVTNYATHIFENGSFYSNAGATDAPNASRYFVGSALTPASDPNNHVTIEVYTSAGTPPLAFKRQKIAGVWQPWTQTGIVTNELGATYISSSTADMSFGISGTAPSSTFFVNAESDASGGNWLTVSKAGAAEVTGGTFQVRSPSANAQLSLSSAAGHAADMYWLGGGIPHWLLRTDGPTTDFGFVRLDGAGAVADVPFTLNWSNGSCKMINTLNINTADATTALKVGGAAGSERFQVTGEMGASIGVKLYFNTGNGVTYDTAAAGIHRWANLGAVVMTLSTAGALSTSSVITAPILSATATTAPTIGSWNTTSGHNYGMTTFSNVLNFGALDATSNPTGVAIKTDAAGNFTVTTKGFQPGGGSWSDSSDARIKNVVSDYQNGLDAIKTLHPVVYTYKGNETSAQQAPSNKTVPDADGSSTKEAAVMPYANSPHYAVAGREFVGLIAQECEAVFPEMVTQSAAMIDGQPVTDLRTLDTTPLIFALVNAIKEMAARIEALEAAQAAP